MARGGITCKREIALALFGLLGLVSSAWGGVNIWDVTPLPGGSIWTIAIDPANPSRVVAAGGRVFFSPDGGTTWNETQNDNGQALAFGSDGTAYMGAVSRSLDGGATWQDLSNELTGPNWTNANALVVVPGNPDTLYVATSQRGLYRSTNRAQNWSYLGGNGLNTNDVRAIAVDPEDHRVLLVGTNDGVYRSENGGASWSPADMGSGNRDVYRLAIGPNGSGENLVWAGTSGGVYRSADTGRTWTLSGLSGSFIEALLWVSPGELYAARRVTGNSLLVSADGGLSWTPVAGLPAYAQVRSLAYSDHLYAGVRGLGIHQMRESGWEATSQGMNGLWVPHMVKSPLDSSVFLGTEAGVLRYRPTTRQVSSLTEGLGNPYVTALVAVERGGSGTGVLHAATEGAGIYSLPLPLGSSPTWTAMAGSGLPAYVEDLAVVSHRPDTLFAVAEGRLYRSGSGGANWQALNNVIPSWYGDGVRLVEVGYDPATRSLVVYAGTHQARVFRSTDGGRNWAERNTSWCTGGWSGCYVAGIWIDPANPATVYLTAGNGGSFRSDDGGWSWNSLTGNDPRFCCGSAVWGLVMDPGNPREIYAINGGAVFRSFNRGNYWQDLSLPVNTQSAPWWGGGFGSLAFARGSNHLFASVAGWVMDAEITETGPIVDNFWMWRSGGIFPGEPLDLQAHVTAGDTAVASVEVLIRTQPNEPPVATVLLNDDGIPPDTTANDGYYAVRWAGTDQLGGYNASVVAEDAVGRQTTSWPIGFSVAHTLVSVPGGMLISPEQLTSSRVPVLIEDDGQGYLSQQEFLSVQLRVHNWSQGLEPLGMHLDATGSALGGLPGLLETSATTRFEPDRKWDVALALASAQPILLRPGTGPQQAVLAYIDLDSMLVNNSNWCNFGINTIMFGEDNQSAVPILWGSNLQLGVGDVDSSRAIEGFDASLVLMHVVDKINLYWTDDPRNDAIEGQYGFTLPHFAAQNSDVTRNMGITALDAALILRRDVGLITHFPAEEPYYRLWDPPAGWWNPPNGFPAPKPLAVSVASLRRSITLGRPAVRDDGLLALPVLIDDMDGVLAGSFSLGFDPSQLQAVRVERSDLTRGYLVEHQVTGGEVRAAFAGVSSTPGTGALARVLFRQVGDAGAGSVVLRRAQINEEDAVALNYTAAAGVMPRQLVLHPNAPNPFNPNTAIAFDLPRDGQVRLSVYNTLGQRVRVLVDETQVAGHHQVLWDGRNQSGAEVASGVYLYRLETEGGLLVRRMLLLK